MFALGRSRLPFVRDRRQVFTLGELSHCLRDKAA